MISIQLQEADYMAAVMLHRRWDAKMWLFVIGGGVCYLLGGVLFLIYAQPDQRFWAYFMFAMAVFVWGLSAWMQLVGAPRGARRRFQQQKALTRPHTISWNDEKLTVDGEDLHAGIGWTDFMKWREDENVFLIYSNRLAFRAVPKRAFPEQAGIADFRRLLGEKIGPQSVARK